MLISITTYLWIVIGLAFFVGLAIYVDDSNKDNFKAFLLLSAAVLFWPISIVIIPIGVVVSKYSDKVEQSMEYAHQRLNLKGTYEHNSEKIREASTADLKLVLKGARAGKVELTSAQIEIIKRELVDRATENGLLK